MTPTAGSSPAAESASVTGREPPRSRFGADFDPASLTTADECQAALAEVAREIVRIEGQIEERTPEARGDEGQRLWLVRARKALGHKRAHRQAIQYRLGRLLREERRTAHAEAAIHDARLAEFAKVCRAQLAPGLVSRLWDEVDARMSGGAA